MKDPVLEVYYDYVSPFAYMATELLGPLAGEHGCAVSWRPIDLHRLSNFAGGMPYSPLKRAYVAVDAVRQAEFHGIDIAFPDPFPVQSAKAVRLALVAQDERRFEPFHRGVFRAAWAESRDIGSDDVLEGVIRQAGGDPSRWLEEAHSSAVEERLAANVTEAEARGIFGVPTVVLRDELFWGIDSFPVLSWRLAGASGTGGA